MCSLVAHIKLPLWKTHFCSLQRHITAMVLQLPHVLRYRCPVKLNCKMFRLLLMVLFASQLSLQWRYNFTLSIKATAEISAALSLFFSAAQSRRTTAFVQLCGKWPGRGTVWPFLTVALVVPVAAVGQPWGEAAECGWSRTWRAYARLRVSGRLPMFVLTRCQSWNWTLRLAKRAVVKLLWPAHRQKSLRDP